MLDLHFWFDFLIKTFGFVPIHKCLLRKCSLIIYSHLFLSLCPRCVRSTAGGGRSGRSHGDGSDLHRPKERRETLGPMLLRHHQVRAHREVLIHGVF